MICNVVECTIIIIVHHDLVDSSNEQWRKKYSLLPVKSHLPRNEEVSKHWAVVLHQCKESTVMEGGWVGGDAWFGLVKSCVELKKWWNAYSSFNFQCTYFTKSVLQDTVANQQVTGLLRKKQLLMWKSFLCNGICVVAKRGGVLPMHISPFDVKEEVQLKIPKHGVYKVCTGIHTL